MDDALSERLVRGVGSYLLPDVSLPLRQGTGDALGDLFSQLANGKTPPGQHVASLCFRQLHRLIETHCETVQRRTDPENEVQPSLLRRRQYTRGEGRSVRHWEVERRAPHAPALKQALLVGDRCVEPAGGHVADSRVQGEQC